jgi:glycosyltransferase involved in cell wall biosynthesis
MVKEVVIENESALSAGPFRLGVVIPTFNRPEYLKYTLFSIANSDLSGQSLVFLLFDDTSAEDTVQLIRDFKLGSIPIIKIFTNRINIVKQNNYTVLPGSAFPFTIRYGCDILFQLGCEYVMNSDSDAMVCHDWLRIVNTTLDKIKDKYFILSGFRCQDAYHKVLSEGTDYALLNSLGGISMTFNKSTYYELMYDSIYDYSFDWIISYAFKKHNYPIYLTKPSIVQHIGVHSSIIRGENNALSECYKYTQEELTIDKLRDLSAAVQAAPQFPFSADYRWSPILVRLI